MRPPPVRTDRPTHTLRGGQLARHSGIIAQNELAAREAVPRRPAWSPGGSPLLRPARQRMLAKSLTVASVGLKEEGTGSGQLQGK